MNIPKSLAIVLSLTLIMGLSITSNCFAEMPAQLDHTVVINDAQRDPFNELLLDQAGNSYLIGATSYESHWYQPDAVMVAKHDAQGKLLWKNYTVRTNPVYSGNDPAIRAQLDSLGNLYILLSGSGGIGELVKYSPDGVRALVANSTICSYCLMHIDQQDNLYIYGSGSVEKYSHGILQWNAAFGSSRASRNINEVAVDGNGDVYLYGDIRSRTAVIPLLVKLDSQGTLLWNQFLHNSDSKRLYGKNLLLDKYNNAFVTAHAGGEEHLAKYDSNGERQFHHRYLNPGLDWYFGSKASINQQGEVTIIATTIPAVATHHNHNDLLMIKYDNSGKQILQRTIDFAASETTHLAMQRDGRGNLYLSIGNTIAKLDPQGELLWRSKIDHTTRYLQIKVDDHGTLYAAGHYAEGGFMKKGNNDVDTIMQRFHLN